MGIAAILLVVCMGPLVYAYPEIPDFIPDFATTYVPEYPRRPIILVWPSVMNPARDEELHQDHPDYVADPYQLERLNHSKFTECINNTEVSFTFHEVRKALYDYQYNTEATDFWKELVPRVIYWVSGHVLECGFETYFKNEIEHIIRFIKANRSKWIRAVQELVFIFLQAIAVIHHKTYMFPNVFRDNKEDEDDEYGQSYWLEHWDVTYQKWYTKEPRAEEYLHNTIRNSLDILTAWLFDYMAQRTGTHRTHRERTRIPFWPHADWSKWDLSEQKDIVCQLGNSYMALNWEHLIDTVDNKMQLMADYFMTCKVLSGCNFKGKEEAIIVNRSTDVIVSIPKPEDCVHICSPLPIAPPLPQNLYSAMDYKSSVYGHAHLTTVVGQKLHCEINNAIIQWNMRRFQDEVHTLCYPLVVEKYLMDRKYKLCKTCQNPCCKRPPPLEGCEIVTSVLSTDDFKTSEIQIDPL